MTGGNTGPENLKELICPQNPFYNVINVVGNLF